MYKLSYRVAHINDDLDLFINFYIQDKDDVTAFTSKLTDKQKEQFATIRKTYWQGTHYIKYTPNPYFELIIDPKDTDYIPYKHIKCNKFDTYLFIRGLEKMTNTFKTKRDLYYYENNVLVLNNDIAKVSTETIRLKDRTILLEPILILNNVTETKHEGIMMYSNTKEVGCKMTYIELEFLLYLFKSTNMDVMATNMWSMIDDKNISENLYVPKNVQPTTEVLPQDNTVTFATPKNGNTIPDI